MANMKAAVYTRVSSVDQHPEMQEAELVDYVKRRGWNLSQGLYRQRSVRSSRTASRTRCTSERLPLSQGRHCCGLEV